MEKFNFHLWAKYFCWRAGFSPQAALSLPLRSKLNMCTILICKNMFTFFLPAGLYPEIPEGSQLDFSALKEEVPLIRFCNSFHLFIYCLLFFLQTVHFTVLILSCSLCVLTDRASGFSCSIILFHSPSCWTNRDKH